MSEKANTSASIDKIKNIPHINVEEKATFEISSFLSNKGEMKNKKKSPLNAKILLAPVINIVLAPSAKIGRESSILNKLATNTNVNKMLKSATGTTIVFTLIIDFLPIKLATTTTNKNIKIINDIGQLLKYARRRFFENIITKKDYSLLR